MNTTSIPIDIKKEVDLLEIVVIQLILCKHYNAQITRKNANIHKSLCKEYGKTDENILFQRVQSLKHKINIYSTLDRQNFICFHIFFE